MRSEWEIFLEAPSAYADVLGAEGLARFEAIVDEQFKKLPRLAPGDDEGDTDSWFERFRPSSSRSRWPRYAAPTRWSG